jgi:hypothetical protein
MAGSIPPPRAAGAGSRRDEAPALDNTDRRRTALRSARGVLLLLAVACQPAAPARRVPPPLPPPMQETLHRLDEGAEADNKARRRAWMAERHRAPPDVDWRAIEAANGARQHSKRNQLAAMAATSTRWSERGSRNQAGRMHVAVGGPDGVLYAGSALGGVWRGTLDGQDWTPIGDNLHGGAHWLAVVPGATPSDPPVVLRAHDGGGLLVTRDAGATWQAPLGIPSVVTGVRRMLVSADGAHTIWVVLRFVNAVGQTRYGVWRSTNAAVSFLKKGNLADFAGDLWTSRTGAGPLYALGDGWLQTSTDLGENWTNVAPLPASAAGGELAGSEAGAPRLWAVLDAFGTRPLYRSDDAGQSWNFLSNVTDYWGSLAASITNANLFAYGGVELWRTADAGASFAKVNGWADYYGDPANKLHADIPGIDVAPDGAGGELWYVSTDGGLYRSTNGLASVLNLSLDGLRVSQYYSTHTSAANPLHVYAGAQDQGWQRADAPPSGPDALLDFAQLISGDYGHIVSGDGTHAWVYCVYPGFILVSRNETNPTLHFEDFPPSGQWGWLPTITADPGGNGRFFFCADRLWRYVKTATPPPDWNASIWSAQDFAASAGEYLSALTFSPLDSQRMYAATSHGRFFRSTDGGITWQPSGGQGPGQHYFYGTALVASALDADTAYAGGSGYQGAPVWRTTDGGLSWHPWSDGLPNTLVYCLAEAEDGSGTLVAGTETSAYRRDAAGAWVDITSNSAPVTIYWSVEAVAAGNLMRFGTYGRGIWDYALDPPCAYEAYGTGLGGTNTAMLDTSSAAQLGTTHTLQLSAAPPSKSGWLVVALAPASLPFKGGTLLLDPAFLLPLAIGTDAAGSANIPLLVPADPQLLGLPVHFQALLPGAPWALSNGLAAVVCR